MENEKLYDIIGIGIGPFNLGLAALTNSIENLNCIFFDMNAEFNWHQGLLIDKTRLQVPFLADLVTLANPCSKFSYVNFLHTKQRLTRFAIHENNYPTRMEYNQYCQWVAGQLPNLHFGERSESVHFNKEKNCYEVCVRQTNSGELKTFHGKHIVIGTGTIPHVPDFFSKIYHPFVFHSSKYLNYKDALLTKKNITIVGSGQSAAEIFYDLMQLENKFDTLSWYTRSERFYPMDYSKLTLEMTSPDYIDYFFNLPAHKRKEILSKQNALYKRINFSLIGEIYDAMYHQSINSKENDCHLCFNAELKDITEQPENLLLKFYHREQEKQFSHETDAIILATGYKYIVPGFLQDVKELIQWNEDGLYQVNRNYSIDKNNSIYIQNAELHTHGFNAADLGMGPYRNALILNTILGYEHFKTEKGITFQTFGI